MNKDHAATLLFASLLSLLLPLLPPAAEAEPLPLEHFTKHGDYLDMRLSPDGKHIAARLRNDGEVMFVVLETETMEAAEKLADDLALHRNGKG